MQTNVKQYKEEIYAQVRKYMVKFAAIVVEDIDNAKYKKLILKNTISTMEMSRDMENEVLLSPLNWYIICRFNKDLIKN